MATLSGIASIVSLLDFGIRSAGYLRQLIQDLRHVPEEVLALSEEVKDFTTVMIELERTYRNVATSASTLGNLQTTTALTQQTRRAQNKLRAVKLFVMEVRNDLPIGSSTVKLRSWLNKKELAAQLRDELRDSKINIQLLMEAHVA